ncbi:MAG: hypothetical protein B0D92_03180 [Spirochaeta sp. LUC14_002_19_P3]|nr:MAG: hypothetical protein B0D92_03180 [Spirochaeta sp. LUC14_002_19_P3]
MTVLLSILSALAYGCGDFTGGLATRRAPVLTVVIWSQVMGALLIIAVQPLIGGEVSLHSWLWGAAAGLSGTAGIGFLYYGLARGLAAVVSPVSALIGAILPVLFGLLLGERPSPLAWIGGAFALAAVILLTVERTELKTHVWASLRAGLISGLGFGGFFILISRSGNNSGLLPLLGARLSSIPVMMLIALMSRRPLALPQGSRLWALGSGIIDMSANIFYLLAVRSGMIIITAAITALYPAPTVLLQMLVFHERLGAVRIIGLLLALAGIVCISVG